MLRRLYFVLADESHALALVRALEAAGIRHGDIHAIAGEHTVLSRLPEAITRRRRSALDHIEHYAWSANLALFAIAAVGFLIALYYQHLGWALTCVALMVATFGTGAAFALMLPDARLSAFRDVLAHNSVLLMVDVPKSRVHEIERLVRRNPNVTLGGVSWTINTGRI